MKDSNRSVRQSGSGHARSHSAPGDTAAGERRDQTSADPKAPAHELIYTGVVLESVQLWDHLKRIKQVKELGLGNFVELSAVVHVGNSEEDREHWKKLYPELAEEIDRVPRAKTLLEKGSPAVISIPEDLLMEEVRLCRENGLYFDFGFGLTSHTGEARRRLLARAKEAGGEYLATSALTGEATSLLAAVLAVLPSSVWKADHGVDVSKMNLQTMHDWFVDRQREVVADARSAGLLEVSSSAEATSQFRLLLEAGIRIPILELVPYEPLAGLAAVRGSARAYESPLWGVLFAFGWYRAPVDTDVPNRARIAYNMFYAGGSRLFSDMNYHFQLHGTPGGFFTEQARPPLRIGEKEFRDFDDPICVAGRKVLSDHYEFVQFHNRPAGGPRVKIGVVLGHLDSYAGVHLPDYVWSVAEPGWETGDAEKTWELFYRLFDAEPWYTPPLKNYWQADPAQKNPYGTPPCGQVDIVPVEAPLEVLQTYSVLVFLGWNTLTEEIYGKLKRYVEAGGRLLMSLPQLSTQLHRGDDLELIHGGDLDDLFGVRIEGPGESTEFVQFLSTGAFKPYEFPKGTLYLEETKLARTRLTSAVALAASNEGTPVLLENRKGEGFCYLLATWGYPGLHLQSFLTDVLRTISNGEQDTIAVQGDSVFYAVYPRTVDSPNDLHTLYVGNKGFYGLPNHCRVSVAGRAVPLRVEAYDMRIVWIAGDLVVSPFDRFVRVERVQSGAEGHVVGLVGRKGRHRIQLACLGSEVGRVLLNGEAQTVHCDEDGVSSFECTMDGAHELMIEETSC